MPAFNLVIARQGACDLEGAIECDIFDVAENLTIPEVRVALFKKLIEKKDGDIYVFTDIDDRIRGDVFAQHEHIDGRFNVHKGEYTQ